MKRVSILFIFLFSVFQISFAKEIDAVWCTKNGGTLNYDAKINCITKDINQTAYIKEIYNSLCFPYYSYIINNKKPLFLKVTVLNNKAHPLFDEFNLIVTKDELLRYI